MRYFPKLKGKKVYLSPINPDDFPLYTKWMNDLAVTVGLGNAAKTISLAVERGFLEKMIREDNHFAIVRVEDDKLLGNVSLMFVDNIHRNAELGLFIGEEEHRGQGYGTEAIELALVHGFRVLNLHNILLRVYSFNEKALGIYEKIGFSVVGRRRRSYFFNGHYYDIVYMDILAEEFDSPLLETVLTEIT